MPLDRVEFIPSWYDRLVSRTNEKAILPEAIRQFAKQHDAQSCLEIGLGTSPFFANRLKDLFPRYLIVEKQTEAMALPSGAEIVKDDWEHFVTDEKFDVIIASHVIYYFQDKQAGVNKIIDHLTLTGSAFIVVNGKDGDYGPLKNAFSTIVGHPYSFTYDQLKKILEGNTYTEHSVASTVAFSSPEDLFETLRLSFDQYPEEYELHKQEILAYFQSSLKDGIFTINQKVFEVTKSFN